MYLRSTFSPKETRHVTSKSSAMFPTWDHISKKRYKVASWCRRWIPFWCCHFYSTKQSSYFKLLKQFMLTNTKPQVNAKIIDSICGHLEIIIPNKPTAIFNITAFNSQSPIIYHFFGHKMMMPLRKWFWSSFQTWQRAYTWNVFRN